MELEESLFCNQKPHHMERFLEVCLLLLLYDEIGYGYGLVEQLSQFGFAESDLNVSTLYRTLRKMEQVGLVTSDWEQGGQGPRRRVYAITAAGRNELDQWVKILKIRKSRIEALVRTYDQKAK
ncbi:MAG: PadR family transcriptional regulator [Spirochaetia bacterium]|nr:PadR family transcriptional regulator [Sphaerochaeta sp.]NBK23660.1 PadR family transcriptional regulator [Spirochaetia bacterium]